MKIGGYGEMVTMRYVVWEGDRYELVRGKLPLIRKITLSLWQHAVVNSMREGRGRPKTLAKIRALMPSPLKNQRKLLLTVRGLVRKGIIRKIKYKAGGTYPLTRIGRRERA